MRCSAPRPSGGGNILMFCDLCNQQSAANSPLPWSSRQLASRAIPSRTVRGGFRNSSVGGVKIDTDGVVSNPQVGELKELQAAWQKGLQQVPADLEKWTDLRFVSLKQLESEIASRPCREQAAARCRPLPRRPAARPIRARLSRPARHRARRPRRRLEGRFARQRRRRDERPARAHARRPDGRAPRRRIVQRQRHQLLDRSDAGRLAAHAANLRPTLGPQRPAGRGQADGRGRRSANDHRHRHPGHEPFRPRDRRRRLPHEAPGDEFRAGPRRWHAQLPHDAHAAAPPTT